MPEDEKPGPVAAQFLDEIEKVGLGSTQTVGMDVIGKHGARDVERDDQVTPARVSGFLTHPPLGSRGRQEKQEEPAHDHGRLPTETGRGRRRLQTLLHKYGNKAVDAQPPMVVCHVPPQADQGHQPQQV